MPLLVKYACGCIGLPPHEETNPAPHGLNVRQGMAFIIRPCDGESDLTCVEREVALEQHAGGLTRHSRFLNLEECKNVLETLAFLIEDGHRYQELRHLLGIPRTETSS